ncbi:hypothetical protein FHT86_003078 [Rhizobium sp. BK313]|uniref:hypothetical protein n=1 Tax=Rhizobium sp. BK313 TaxID=2587081 RepID=UPI00105D5CB0|nr:hypothetical protein [Rhizobium sp. BK313]MBB3454779.1 hypothetical protein [Rhizobium sp. BK313]
MTATATGILPVTTTSAEELRRRELEFHIVELEWEERTKAREAEKHAAFVDDLFRGQIGEAERTTIKLLITKAAANGQCEAMVYSFPAGSCTDNGRAIENNLPHWRKTLQGNAKQFGDLFTAAAKPDGYGLKAAIINFAGGCPADVGFFFTWEPSSL